jgi:site-specific recombinase XerD
VVEHWGSRRLDEPTPSEIRQLMAWVKTHVVARRNAQGDRSAEEHLVAALRCLYRRAVEDGLIAEADDPARKVAKPRRLPSTRRAVPEARLAEINEVAAATGDDPDLDALLLRLHTETVCRRGGALALRPADLDQGQCLVLLREKGETVRWQPVSPALMARLVQHGRERHAPADRQLLRYASGQPITSRRYDHLWTRIGRHLPWVRTQQISMHWIRHTTLTWVKGRGVASDATFGSSRERAVPAAQRAALRCARPAGTPRGYGDLGLQGAPVSDAADSVAWPASSLRLLAPRCTREQPVAPGASSPDPASGARPAPQLRGTRRTSASLAAPRVPPGNQPLSLHLMHPRPRRRMFALPPARPSPARHAAGPTRRGRGRHASQSPTGPGHVPGGGV